eukprot:3694077-Pyramimonas_sp.AAC.1
MGGARLMGQMRLNTRHLTRGGVARGKCHLQKGGQGEVSLAERGTGGSVTCRKGVIVITACSAPAGPAPFTW